MMLFLVCSLIAAGCLIIGWKLVDWFPRLHCLLFGHDEKIDRVNVVGDLRWRCVACGKEVKPL